MMKLRTAKLREPAWRVHSNPTALPNFPAKDETPPNRFDDPKREYRVRYWATNKLGAFLEVLSRFRTNGETQARLGAVKGVNEKTDPKITPGTVPLIYLRTLKEVTGQVTNLKHEFVDVANPETQTALNKHPNVRQTLKDSGLGEPGSPAELDEATIRLRGPRGYLITQAISRIVYDETEAVGIRYTSRLDVMEPCWAIFDWADVKFSKTTPINTRGASLRSAALILGLNLP